MCSESVFIFLHWLQLNHSSNSPEWNEQKFFCRLPNWHIFTIKRQYRHFRNQMVPKSDILEDEKIVKRWNIACNWETKGREGKHQLSRCFAIWWLMTRVALELITRALDVTGVSAQIRRCGVISSSENLERKRVVSNDWRSMRLRLQLSNSSGNSLRDINKVSLSKIMNSCWKMPLTKSLFKDKTNKSQVE